MNKYPTKKLSEICKIIGWWTPSKSNPQYYNGDILWASVRDMKDEFLEDLEPKFASMKCRGIKPSEKMKPQAFWAMVKKELPPIDGQMDFLPCECSI